MKDIIKAILTHCLSLGILALILVFGFGRALLDAFRRGDWIWIGVFAFCVLCAWIGSKIADKTRKK